jgi:hypothetical protein
MITGEVYPDIILLFTLFDYIRTARLNEYR